MKYAAHFIVIFALSSGLFAQSTTAQFKIIPADDNAITYVGRTLVDSNGQVSFDWTGVYLRTQFTGGYCSVQLSDTKANYFDLFIDGNRIKTFIVKNDTSVVLASGMGEEAHELMLYKRTEGEQGTTTITHFTVTADGTLLPSNVNPAKRILFIGNSITCGFGAIGSDPTARFSPATENSYLSYASIASRYFDADYQLIAHSGMGVVRNYGDPHPLSRITMRDRFLRVFDQDSTHLWQFDRWIPDVVIVKLGTNDLSNPAICPTREQFIAGYLDLIASIRNCFGTVPIICLTSCMSGDKLADFVQNAVKQSSDEKVFFVEIKREMLNPSTDFGAAHHPNYEGQKKMASVLIPYLSTIMNWQLTNKPIM